MQETSSYTRDEWHQMHRLGAGVWLFENFGILRQVASYVRAETGRREVDFYEALIEASAADPDSWPYTAVVLRVLPHAMVPPISWRFFLDEIRRWLVDVEGIADDDALVRQAQLHRERRSADQVHRRHHDQHDARPADHHQFQPSQAVPGHQCHGDHREDHPAERSDHRRHPRESA